MEISVTGAAQLDDLARRLRQAGRTDLRLELTRAVRAAARPVADAAKRDVLALPSRGRGTGLRRRVARAVRLSVRSSGRDVGAKVFVKGGDHLGPRTTTATMARHMDEGTWRHPVWGNDWWVTQSVPPGWFTRPTRDAAPKARAEIGEALHRIKDQIEG